MEERKIKLQLIIVTMSDIIKIAKIMNDIIVTNNNDWIKLIKLHTRLNSASNI